MKTIEVTNNQAFKDNLQSLVNTFDLNLLNDLTIKSEPHNKQGFEISKVGSDVLIKHSEDHYFYNAMAYVLMNQDKKVYNYSNGSKIKRTGIMLDTARNAVPKIKTIQSYIQMMSLLGFNYLELYVEDVFEVIDEPKIGYMRGKYSINDLKNLDSYAKSYGIELVPCIQTLAHLERIFMHDTYASIHDIEDVLLVGAEKTYELIENMVKTCRLAFGSNRINIGMDEAFRLGLGAYLAKHGYQTKTEIMLAHLDKVTKILDKYDYHGMMWADMFFQMSGGNYHLDEIEITEEIIKRVPENITLIFWEYYDTTFSKYDNKFKQVRRMTNDYAFAGGAWKWVGFSPLNEFSIKAMAVSIAACQKHEVNDYLVTLWGDDGAEASHYSIVPSLIYASQAFYSHEDINKVHNDFSLLLSNYTFKELMTLDTLNSLNNIVDVKNPSKYLLFDDILMGRLDYPVSKEFSMLYKDKTITLEKLSIKSSKFNYLFETQFRLSDVLTLKTELTNSLYNAYKTNNRLALSELLPAFDLLIKKMNIFYQAFTTQWHIENKAYGFEVQNYRIGGLISRVSYIKDLVSKYVKEEIDQIEALEEKVMDLNNDNVVAYNGFLRTVTYGKM